MLVETAVRRGCIVAVGDTNTRLLYPLSFFGSNSYLLSPNSDYYHDGADIQQPANIA